MIRMMPMNTNAAVTIPVAIATEAPTEATK